MKKKIVKKLTAAILMGCLMTTTVCVPVMADSIVIEEPTEESLKDMAAAIVKKQVKSADSKKTKLSKLFKYTEKTYGYARTTSFSNKKGWEKTYAKKMFMDKKGSCYHFAAAYGFLAKQATGYPVRICVGQTKGFSGKWQPHAWTEVKIGTKWYICDTNMDKFAAKSSGKYYLKSKTSSAMKAVYKAGSYVTVKF